MLSLNFKIPIFLVLGFLFICASCEKKEDTNEYLVGKWYAIEYTMGDGTIIEFEADDFIEFNDFYHAPGIIFCENSTYALYSIEEDGSERILTTNSKVSEWSISDSGNLLLYREAANSVINEEFVVDKLNDNKMTLHQSHGPEGSWDKYKKQ